MSRFHAIRSAFGLGLVLFPFWLLLSGMFEVKLLVFGLFSVILVCYLSQRMAVTNHQGESIHTHIRYPRYYLYWALLLAEVAKSSVQVVGYVLNPRYSITPAVIRVRCSQTTDMGKVNYANSITRTPGTVTLDLQGDELVVHALTGEIGAALCRGDMDRRVRALEVLP